MTRGATTTLLITRLLHDTDGAVIGFDYWDEESDFRDTIKPSNGHLNAMRIRVGNEIGREVLVAVVNGQRVPIYLCHNSGAAYLSVTPRGPALTAIDPADDAADPSVELNEPPGPVSVTEHQFANTLNRQQAAGGTVMAGPPARFAESPAPACLRSPS